MNGSRVQQVQQSAAATKMMQVRGWVSRGPPVVQRWPPVHHQGLGAVGATGRASHSVPLGPFHSSCRAAAPLDGGQYCSAEECRQMRAHKSTARQGSWAGSMQLASPHHTHIDDDGGLAGADVDPCGARRRGGGRAPGDGQSADGPSADVDLQGSDTESIVQLLLRAPHSAEHPTTAQRAANSRVRCRWPAAGTGRCRRPTRKGSPTRWRCSR